MIKKEVFSKEKIERLQLIYFRRSLQAMIRFQGQLFVPYFLTPLHVIL